MKRNTAILTAIVAAAAILPAIGTPYLMHMVILTMFGIAMATAWSISDCCGLGLGHAAFYGAGAYASMVLLKSFGISPVIGAAVGVLVAAGLAVATGGLIFRLTASDYTLGSIAVAEIIRTFVNNVPSVTNGTEGINAPDITAIDALAKYVDFGTKIPFYYTALVLVLGVMAVSWWLQNSKLGYYLKAIKEDADAACSLGINLTWYKTSALCLSAAIMACVGSLYAVYIKFIDPATAMSLVDISIESMLMAVLGGVAVYGGPAIGALILIPLGELLRSNLIGETMINMGLVDADGRIGQLLTNLSHAHILIYGIMIVIVVRKAPQGVVPYVREKLASRRAKASVKAVPAMTKIAMEGESK